MVTPQSIENRLVVLSKETDDAHEQLVTAELTYHKAKAAYELNLAKERITLSQNKDLRVQTVQDLALSRTSEQYEALMISEALVKSARANATRIRTQVDIARSVGTSVRASLEI